MRRHEVSLSFHEFFYYFFSLLFFAIQYTPPHGHDILESMKGWISDDYWAALDIHIGFTI